MVIYLSVGGNKTLSNLDLLAFKPKKLTSTSLRSVFKSRSTSSNRTFSVRNQIHCIKNIREEVILAGKIPRKISVTGTNRISRSIKKRNKIELLAEVATCLKKKFLHMSRRKKINFSIVKK